MNPVRHRSRSGGTADVPCVTVSQSYGGHSGGETPGPIPNPEAKPSSADGTALDRVWESRTPPNTISQNTPRPPGPGVFCISKPHPTKHHTRAELARTHRGKRTQSATARTIAPRTPTNPRAPDKCARIRDDQGRTRMPARTPAATRASRHPDCRPPPTPSDQRARIRHLRAESHPDQPHFPRT